MKRELVDANVNVKNQNDILLILNEEINDKLQKINSFNEHKSKLVQEVKESKETNEEDPEEVKRRMLEEMKKGQSDKKMTHQDIQNRQNQVQDVMMNINYEENKRDNLQEKIDRLKENLQNKKF